MVTEEIESLRNDPSSKLRSTVLSRAVKGYPSKKVNSDGLPQINWSQIDPNRVHLKTVYNGNGNSSMQVTFDPGNKTRTQMIDSHFATMNSLSGSSGYARYIEGSQAEEDSHTGSRINLNKAIGWILGCEQSHELCARTIQSKSALPTRVIDLGPPRSNQVPYIYTSRGEFARYCTLSHRWGKNTILSTLKQNIEAHKLRLPLELMSSNFKDAIEVCRELCVRYLWIDSLCIIQDSREDWEEESAKMGDYYWNSFFTIAADHASDYYQGCFSRRDPYSIQPCNITFTFPHEIDRAIAEVRVAPRIQDGIDWRHKQYSILDTRSWVLQERVLSPRTLFFGEHQLTFCCITMRASESIPEGSDRTGANVQASFEEFQRKIRTFNAALQDGRPIDVTSNGAARTGTRTDMQTGEMVTSMEPEFNDKRQEQPKHLLELRSNWYELLVEYNKRSITQKSDVFPALSGLAQRFHKILGETYFAGIWSGDLIGGLLWSVDMNSQKGESYRAPSWSWACLRSCRLRFNCNYENVIGDPICRIFKVEVTTRTSNPYGEVVGGKLFVKGILKMARAVIPPAVVEHLANEVPDMDIRYGSVDDLQFREIGDGIDLEKGECAYLEDHESGEQLSKFEPDGLFDTSIDNGLVFCVPLLIQRNMFGNQAALCLVLQPIHLQSSRWKRVGFARMLKTEWFNGANAFPLTIE